MKLLEQRLRSRKCLKAMTYRRKGRSQESKQKRRQQSTKTRENKVKQVQQKDAVEKAKDQSKV